MHTVHRSGSIIVALLIISFGSMGFVPQQDIVYGREKITSGRKIGAADLTRLLDEAAQELKAADLSQKEIRIRLRIVTNVATVKSY